MEILFLYYLSLILAILAHEIGHLMAVFWVGHKLTEFAVGPMSIKWSGAGYSIKARKSLFTGLVAYERIYEKTSWENELLIIAGGVLANFILGVVFVVYYYFISSNGLIAIIGWVSILLGVLNLFPMHVKELGLDSDAKRFFSMLSFRNAIAQFKSYDLNAQNVQVELQSPCGSNHEKAQIEFFNDDVTPMDFVVDIIRMFFKLDDFSATLLMLSIHNDGKGKLGWIDFNLAKIISDKINFEAQIHGFPFQCKVTKET